MSEEIEISTRFGKNTHRIVKRRIVPEVDNIDSTKEFYEIAVKSNALKIQALSAGGLRAQVLIEVLDELRGITVQVPEDEVKAVLLNSETRDSPSRLELSPKHVGVLDDVALETGLSQSEIVRRCVLRQLNKLTQKYGILSGWRKRAVLNMWEKVEKRLQRPRLQCYDSLQRKFLDEVELTQRRIEADPAGFEPFAEEYTEEFYESKAYKQLREQRPERVFRNVENVIEEYTDYRVPIEENDRREEPSEFLKELREIR